MNNALTYAARLSNRVDKGPVDLEEILDDESEFNAKIKKFISLFKNAKYIVVHTGAGISTSCGIPDFRGPRGVWTLEAKERKQKNLSKVVRKRKQNNKERINKKKEGKDFSESIAQKNVEKEEENLVMYGNKKRKIVDFSLALPSYTHILLKKLVDKKIVKHIITQNVDNLHLLSGLKFNQLSELHGNMFTERCDLCGRRYMRAYTLQTINFNPTGRVCALCTFPPTGVCTDVLLDWNNTYENVFYKNAIFFSKNADLNICMGSSLQIQPASEFPLLNKYNSRSSKNILHSLDNSRFASNNNASSSFLPCSYLKNLNYSLSCPSISATSISSVNFHSLSSFPLSSDFSSISSLFPISHTECTLKEEKNSEKHASVGGTASCSYYSSLNLCSEFNNSSTYCSDLTNDNKNIYSNINSCHYDHKDANFNKSSVARSINANFLKKNNVYKNIVCSNNKINDNAKLIHSKNINIDNSMHNSNNNINESCSNYIPNNNRENFNKEKNNNVHLNDGSSIIKHYDSNHTCYKIHNNNHHHHEKTNYDRNNDDMNNKCNTYSSNCSCENCVTHCSKSNKSCIMNDSSYSIDNNHHSDYKINIIERNYNNVTHNNNNNSMKFDNCDYRNSEKVINLEISNKDINNHIISNNSDYKDNTLFNNVEIDHDCIMNNNYNDVCNVIKKSNDINNINNSLVVINLQRSGLYEYADLNLHAEVDKVSKIVAQEILFSSKEGRKIEEKVMEEDANPEKKKKDLIDEFFSAKDKNVKKNNKKEQLKVEEKIKKENGREVCEEKNMFFDRNTKLFVLRLPVFSLPFRISPTIPPQMDKSKNEARSKKNHEQEQIFEEARQNNKEETENLCENSKDKKKYFYDKINSKKNITKIFCVNEDSISVLQGDEERKCIYISTDDEIEASVSAEEMNKRQEHKRKKKKICYFNKADLERTKENIREENNHENRIKEIEEERKMQTFLICCPFILKMKILLCVSNKVKNINNKKVILIKIDDHRGIWIIQTNKSINIKVELAYNRYGCLSLFYDASICGMEAEVWEINLIRISHFLYDEKQSFKENVKSHSFSFFPSEETKEKKNISCNFISNFFLCLPFISSDSSHSFSYSSFCLSSSPCCVSSLSKEIQSYFSFSSFSFSSSSSLSSSSLSSSSFLSSASYSFQTNSSSSLSSFFSSFNASSAYLSSSSYSSLPPSLSSLSSSHFSTDSLSSVSSYDPKRICRLVCKNVDLKRNKVEGKGEDKMERKNFLVRGYEELYLLYSLILLKKKKDEIVIQEMSNEEEIKTEVEKKLKGELKKKEASEKEGVKELKETVLIKKKEKVNFINSRNVAACKEGKKCKIEEPDVDIKANLMEKNNNNTSCKDPGLLWYPTKNKILNDDDMKIDRYSFRKRKTKNKIDIKKEEELRNKQKKRIAQKKNLRSISLCNVGCIHEDEEFKKKVTVIIKKKLKELENLNFMKVPKENNSFLAGNEHVSTRNKISKECGKLYEESKSENGEQVIKKDEKEEKKEIPLVFNTEFCFPQLYLSKCVQLGTLVYDVHKYVEPTLLWNVKLKENNKLKNKSKICKKEIKAEEKEETVTNKNTNLSTLQSVKNVILSAMNEENYENFPVEGVREERINEWDCILNKLVRIEHCCSDPVIKKQEILKENQTVEGQELQVEEEEIKIDRETWKELIHFPCWMLHYLVDFLECN